MGLSHGDVDGENQFNIVVNSNVYNYNFAGSPLQKNNKTKKKS